jgi:hypothetical protein
LDILGVAGEHKVFEFALRKHHPLSGGDAEKWGERKELRQQEFSSGDALHQYGAIR